MAHPQNRLLSGRFALLILAVVTLALVYLLLHGALADEGSRGVKAWWVGLCSVTIFNVCCWCVSANALARRRDAIDPVLYRFQRRQLILSAVYVLGCGFRSVLPRADVQRIGLFDSWLSSVMVGRSVATLAEVCFVIQWALLLNLLARDAESRFGVVISWIIVPLIVIAEACSWYAVLTTCYLGNAIEESIWTLVAILVIGSCMAIWSRCRAGFKPLLAVAIVFGVCYVAFMCLVDVPMYLSRWLEDEGAGRQYLTLAKGVHDAWAQRSVTFDWEQWRTEIPWMSLYFSVAVWFSIALIRAPWVASKPQFVPA